MRTKGLRHDEPKLESIWRKSVNWERNGLMLIYYHVTATCFHEPYVVKVVLLTCFCELQSCSKAGRRVPIACKLLELRKSNKLLNNSMVSAVRIEDGGNSSAQLLTAEAVRWLSTCAASFTFIRRVSVGLTCSEVSCGAFLMTFVFSISYSPRTAFYELCEPSACWNEAKNDCEKMRIIISSKRG